MKQYIYGLLLWGVAVLTMVSCQDYETDEYQVGKVSEYYEGTLYDYLADKSAHPNVTFDSLLFLADRLPALKDSLQGRKVLTLFAVTDKSFELAFRGLNLYRNAYGKGRHLAMEDLLIEPFTVIDTIVRQVSTEEYDTVYVSRHYDYRKQLDSMVCCYMFDGGYSMSDIQKLDATEIPCISYGHLMRLEAGRGNASGAEGLGARYMCLIETWNSKVTTTWVKAGVENPDIKTTNGWLHILSGEHEFGFNGIEQTFYDYGNEKSKK